LNIVGKGADRLTNNIRVRRQGTTFNAVCMFEKESERSANKADCKSFKPRGGQIGDSGETKGNTKVGREGRLGVSFGKGHERRQAPEIKRGGEKSAESLPIKTRKAQRAGAFGKNRGKGKEGY